MSMEQTKYVMLEYGGVPTPLLFSDMLSHADFRDYRPIRAGFVQIVIGEEGKIVVATFGKSQTLKLESAPEDGEIIRKQLVLNDD